MTSNLPKLGLISFHSLSRTQKTVVPKIPKIWDALLVTVNQQSWVILSGFQESYQQQKCSLKPFFSKITPFKDEALRDLQPKPEIASKIFTL